MPWRYAPPPTSPFCTEYARRKVGKSVTGRLAAVTRRVDTLEAVTVFDSRQPRGLYLQGGGSQPMIPIDFDSDGRILVTSSDGSVSLARNPWARKSVLDIVVGLAARCFGVCLSVSSEASAVQFRPVGYMQLPRDNGDGTCTCVAVPYMNCGDAGDCGDDLPPGHQ